MPSAVMRATLAVAEVYVVSNSSEPLKAIWLMSGKPTLRALLPIMPPKPATTLTFQSRAGEEEEEEAVGAHWLWGSTREGWEASSTKKRRGAAMTK
jgi:hypothetical protein